MSELLGIMLRLTVMYFYALALMRLSGKRSLGNLTALDFVMTLIIGDLFDNAFWGSGPLGYGLFAIGILVILHGLVAVATAQSPWLDRVLTGSKAVLVIQDGKFVQKGLSKERTRKSEVQDHLELEGVEKVKTVREARWEANGDLSVLKKEEYEPVQKKDLEKLKELLR